MRNLKLRRTRSQTEKKASLPLPQKNMPSRCLNQWKTDENTNFLQNVFQRQIAEKSLLAISSEFLLNTKLKKKSCYRAFFYSLYRTQLVSKLSGYQGRQKWPGSLKLKLLGKDIANEHLKSIKMEWRVWKWTWILKRLFQGTCRYGKKC